MALVECPECAAEISSEAKACPKCGIALAGKKSIGCVGMGLAGILAAMIVGTIFSGASQKYNTVQQAAPASNGLMTVTKDTFGCLNREDFDNMISILASGDNAAFDKQLTIDALTGACIYLTKGRQVYLVDSKFGSGIKVRPAGEVTDYWMDPFATK